ncbi:MAG: hypothetical protein QFC55_05295 [Chloroflexota bacterium]|nr:hypothetical protein [Chloroflexota bacterium]
MAIRQERELRMVREAIAMVASGASSRVVVAGISAGDQILDAARRLGLEAGVRVNRLSQQENRGADLAVEPICE